jgi:hypothetical protein
MYTIFQSIPILSRSPYPQGYGENAVATSNMLLPIPIASLVAGPITGFIIYRLGAARSIIISTMIIAIGYVTITQFYLSEFYMPLHLFIISIGYLFINTAALNLIIFVCSKKYDWYITWTCSISQIYWCCYRSGYFRYVYVDPPFSYWQ